MPFDDLDECLVESEEKKNYNTKTFGADVGWNEKSLDETSRNQSPSVNRQEDSERKTATITPIPTAKTDVGTSSRVVVD